MRMYHTYVCKDTCNFYLSQLNFALLENCIFRLRSLLTEDLKISPTANIFKVFYDEWSVNHKY